MNQVLAAGVILFRSDLSTREYLLLQKQNEKWAPAKGRLEKDETDFEAALRETWEETGLVENKDYELINKNFTIINMYKTRTNRDKRVVYWLARVKEFNVEIKLSDEHKDFKWLSYDQIMALYHKTDMIGAIVDANDFLSKNTQL